MKVLIIGAGWYGLHIGMVLKRLGIDFCINEKADSILSASSFKNQNRLHLGYHYPRSSKTRELCNTGYYKFIEDYGSCVSELSHNYYSIADDSIIDFETYLKIVGIDNNQQLFLSELRNVQATIDTNELFINHIKAKNFFMSELGNRVILNSEIHLTLDLCHNYDWVINCTNNVINCGNTLLHYEKTLSLVYRKIKETNSINGYTIMDGPFCSLYPFDMEKKLYTLTDVIHTPLIKSKDYSVIKEHLLTPLQLESKKMAMESKMEYYLSNFKENYKYEYYFESLKVKKEKDNTDNRELHTSISGNVINICCDKITGIFHAEDFINTLMQN